MNFRVDTTAISCRSRTQVALQRAYTLHAYSFSLIVKRRPFLRKDRSIEIRSRASKDTEVVWDPEGLFKGTQNHGSYFKDSQESQTPSVDTIDPNFLLEHPIKPIKGRLSDTKRFKKILSEKYMPVDVDLPNIHILHLDPPIFLVEEVFNNSKCLDIIETLKSTGKMTQSTVGAGNLYSTTVKGSSRRTSSSVLINQDLQDAFPDVKRFAETLQEKIFDIFQGHKLGAWGQPGRQPLYQQYCFEALQAAEYQEGQHFLEHEDAFPLNIADENRFQRHATALLYLNDVESGGETRFSHLGISVKPRAGSLLIFFPAFSDGRPDQRTLHIATDAKDVKWVTQQWIARGFSSAMESHKANQQEENIGKLLKIRKQRKGKATVSKGFSNS